MYRSVLLAEKREKNSVSSVSSVVNQIQSSIELYTYGMNPNAIIPPIPDKLKPANGSVYSHLQPEPQEY